MDLSFLNNISPIQTFIGGGAAMALASAITAHLTGIPIKIWGCIYRRITIQLDLDNSNHSMRHVLKFINDNYYEKFRSFSPLVNNIYRQDYKFGLGNRTFWGWYKWRLFKIDKIAKDQVAPNNDTGMLNRLEALSITFFSINKRIIEDFIADIEAIQKKETQNKTKWIYCNSGAYWTKLNEIQKRPISSLSFEENVLDSLIADLDRFLKSKDLYSERGLPYQRGYLLHGPPGTGKTSIIKCLASIFDADIYELSFSESEMSDMNLKRLLAKTALEDSDRLFFAIEDIDRILTNKNNVTMSGVLNCINGINQNPGQIIIATTNHIENLDPALMRDGRFDVIVKIDYSTVKQVENYINKYYSSSISIQGVPEKMPMAYVQNCCIKNATPEGALESILKYIPRVNNDTNGSTELLQKKSSVNQ